VPWRIAAGAGSLLAAFAVLAPCLQAGSSPDVPRSQHEPVYTLGKRGSEADDLLVAPADVAARGAAVVTCGRGGQATYHGPGQVVAYPIVGVRDLGIGARRYVEALEDAMITAAARWGVAARGRVPGRTGVWTAPPRGGGGGGGSKKLGAVGVRLRGGVSTHGLALNVARGLSGPDGPFSLIRPCGLGVEDATPASLEGELDALSGRGVSVPVEDVAAIVAEELARRLGYAGVDRLPADAADLAAGFAAGAFDDSDDESENGGLPPIGGAKWERWEPAGQGG